MVTILICVNAGGSGRTRIRGGMWWRRGLEGEVIIFIEEAKSNWIPWYTVWMPVIAAAISAGCAIWMAFMKRKSDKYLATLTAHLAKTPLWDENELVRLGELSSLLHTAKNATIEYSMGSGTDPWHKVKHQRAAEAWKSIVALWDFYRVHKDFLSKGIVSAFKEIIDKLISRAHHLELLEPGQGPDTRGHRVFNQDLAQLGEAFGAELRAVRRAPLKED